MHDVIHLGVCNVDSTMYNVHTPVYNVQLLFIVFISWYVHCLAYRLPRVNVFTYLHTIVYRDI